jgi:predicted nucleic acid-binding protein
VILVDANLLVCAHAPRRRNIARRIAGGRRTQWEHAAGASLAEHGLTLCSSDGDFARFQGLRWENPLAD